MTRHPEFEVHMLTEKGSCKSALIRDAFDELLDKLEDIIELGNERQFAIVKTKLEEACFFAKKAMAKDNSQ